MELITHTKTHPHSPDSVEERGLLVDVMMVLGEGAAGSGAVAAAATPDTRAVEEEEGVGVAVCREPELSSRAIASLFSFDLRFWNQTWMTRMSSPVLDISSSLICLDGFCSLL